PLLGPGQRRQPEGQGRRPHRVGRVEPGEGRARRRPRRRGQTGAGPAPGGGFLLLDRQQLGEERLTTGAKLGQRGHGGLRSWVRSSRILPPPTPTSRETAPRPSLTSLRLP